MMVFAVGLRLMNSSAPLLVLESAGEAPKSLASAVAGSAQLLAATAASFLVGVFQGAEDHAARPMVLVMIAVMACGSVGFLLRGAKT
jgi:hypothetical protein